MKLSGMCEIFMNNTLKPATGQHAFIIASSVGKLVVTAACSSIAVQPCQA
jgi:hypothetical protein